MMSINEKLSIFLGGNFDMERITSKRSGGLYELSEGQEIYGEENGVRLVQIVGKYEDIKEICTKGIVLNIAYNPLDKTMATKVFHPSEYEISYCFAKNHIVAVPYEKVELYDKTLVVYNAKNAKTNVFEFNKFNVNTLGGWFVFDKNNRHGEAQKGY